jgi:hypothetical protein
MWIAVFYIVMTCNLVGTLKMKVIHSSEMLVTTYMTSQPRRPKTKTEWLIKRIDKGLLEDVPSATKIDQLMISMVERIAGKTW